MNRMFRRITVLFLCVALLVCGAVTVGADVGPYPTQGCVIDLFIPGYSNQYGKTGGGPDYVREPNSSVVVSDISEAFDDLHEKLVSNIKNEEDGKCSIEVSNVVRQGNSLILDCNAVANLVKNDSTGLAYSEYRATLYVVTVDKESGEIVRYDFVHDILPDGWDDEDPSTMNARFFDYQKECTEIILPAGIDTERFGYYFCVLVYGNPFECPTCDYVGVYLSSLTNIPVPTKDSVYGDANEDGALNLSDATKILKYIAKWDGIELNRYLCDVDGNLWVGMTDVSRILKLIAGWVNI